MSEFDKDYFEEEDPNLALDLDDDELEEIGRNVVEGFDRDEQSVLEWRERNEEWVKLAMQIREDKSFPWHGAANIKYPLLTTAAMQFNSRALPSLIPDNQPVKCRVVGSDPDGTNHEAAQRVSQHMSYQVIEEMEEWEEEMDKMLLILPIIGTAFKKTYYDPVISRNRSELVMPSELTVDYYASSLEDAYRKTHKLYLTKNDLHVRVNSGMFLDCDIEDLQQKTPVHSNVEGRVGLNSGDEPSSADESTPILVLESHTFYDMDEDGYEEPYIIWVEYNSKKVLRISRRWDINGFNVDPETGEVVYIEPVEYFTKYSFVPNPDGALYDLGFGNLLAPVNEVINTTTNQLLDAGTMSTMQSGFISKGLRIKNGSMKISPGRWNVVNSTGEELSKGIYPLPAKEPSGVLFNLLNMMVESGQQLAGVTNPMLGEAPGQNQKAATTMSVIEQGSKVFHSIYKRIHRSLKKEFRKIYRLNSFHISGDEYFAVVGSSGKEDGGVVGPSDYQTNSIQVVPGSDANVSTQEKRLAKAMGLQEMMMAGTVNPQEATRRILDAQEQHDIDALMDMPEPQPDPEMVLKEQELQHKAQMEQDAAQREWFKLELEKIKVLSDASRAVTDSEEREERVQMDVLNSQLNTMLKEADLEIKNRQVDLQEMKMSQQEKQDGDERAVGGMETSSGDGGSV